MKELFVDIALMSDISSQIGRLIVRYLLLWSLNIREKAIQMPNRNNIRYFVGQMYPIHELNN